MHDWIAELIAVGYLQKVLLWMAFASTVIIIVVIISENRNPVKSLAWVTVLLILPIVGLLLYIFFGRNIKNKHIVSRRNRRKLRQREKCNRADITEQGLSEEAVQQIYLCRSLTGAQYYPDSNVELFHTGVEKFAQLKADLRQAKKTINLQYYIIEDDNTGREISDILKERAGAGVTVRVIYDHVGSFGCSNKYFKELRTAGVKAVPFFKVTFPWLGTHINWRNHRKIVVIDDTVAYIGGMNIADRYSNDRTDKGRWRDTHLRIKGAAVAALKYSFAVDWAIAEGELIEDSAFEGDSSYTSLRTDNMVKGVGIQIITGGPTSQWSNISMAFHKAIATAQRRIYIQTPYFLPSEGLLHALQSAALSHVDVRIMLPEHSDSTTLSYASASYIAECIKAGIKMYLYRPGMLHAKMLIVDEEMVSIGSTNFDFRSFDFNFEANAFLYSRAFNKAAVDIFLKDCEDCCRIHPSAWRRRPFAKKAAESILRLLSPIL